MTRPETTTLLFTDVVASTDLANRVGDDECRRLLDSHEQVIREELGRHGGREIKTMGDGFMAAFEEARAALACAITVQRRLAAEVPGVHVRMGLHAGEVVDRGGDLFGATVNASARISAHARGRQILISDDLVPHADGLDELGVVDRGLFWLKGFPERWRLHEVRWGGDGAVAVAHDRTPYIGREEELADLRRHLEEALAGRGSLVLVGGEPGVGKTRLAEEVAGEADQRGARVLVGHCSQMEGAVPYIAWVEVLEQAVARARSPEALRALLGESAGEIARIVPELRRMYGDIPPPVDLPPEQERRYLFNSIRGFIARAADVRPLVLILDDLHWADEPTLLLLEHLAEELHDMPALVIGTYRDVELEVDRPLARSLEGLLRRRLAERIPLKRLGQDAVAEMLAALAGQDPPPEVVTVVYEETEGNAFFVEEVFQHLHEEGRLLDERGRWRRDVRVGEVDVPESVRLVIGRRLQRLPDEARKVLAAASTIGRFFDVGLLEAVAETGEDELLDALEAAEVARLIAPSADDADRFEFAHELIRQTLLAGLSALRRQRLHRKVADAIEGRLGDRAEERAEELVHHLLNAGSGADSKKLLRFLIAAGERGMAAAAWEDAHRHFENALALAEGDRRVRADVLVKAGFALRSMARLQDAAAAWRAALDIFSELGDAEAAAGLCNELAFDLGYSGRTGEGIEFVQRGLAVSEGMRNEVRARLLAAGMTYLAWSGDRAGALAMEREALDLAREVGDPWLEAYIHGARATADYLYMDLAGTLVAAERARTLDLGEDRLWERALLLSLVEFTHVLRGERDAAEAVARELVPMAERIGSGFAILLHARAEGLRAIGETGDLAAFERFAREDMERCERLEQMWVSQSYTLLALAAFWRGRWDEAFEHHARALALEFPGAFEGWSEGVRFLHLATAGRVEEAAEVYRGWGGRLPPVDGPITFGPWSMALYAVDVMALLGRREEAARLGPYADRALAEGTLLRVFDALPIAAVAALAAAAAGRWDEAEARFAEALQLAGTLPLRISVPEVRRLHAYALLEWGEPGEHDRGRRLLEEAVAGYRDLGMPRHLELTEALLARGAETTAG